MDSRRPARALTIDLGDVSVPEPVETVPPVSSAVRRRLRTALVVLLVLFGVAGATPGPRHLIAPLWTLPISLAGFTAGPQRLTASDPGTNTLTGRDLGSGAIRWRLRTSEPPRYLTATPAGLTSVVLPDVDFDQTQAVAEGEVTLLVDEAGTILARLPGSQVMLTPTTSMLVVASGAESVAIGCPDGVRCSDLAGLDLVGRRQVWRLALPGVMVPAAPAVPGAPAGPGAPAPASTGAPVAALPPSRFAMVQPDGRVEVRSPATADLLTAFDLPAELLAGGGTPQLLQVGDSLLVAVRHGARADVAAFPLGPTGLGWQVVVPLDPAGGGRFYLAPCGQLVCLHADAADVLLEPRTGRLRGRVGYQVIGQVGDTLLAVPAAEQAGTPQSRRSVTLLSASDGRIGDQWPDTAVVPWSNHPGEALLARQGAAGTTFTAIDGRGGSRLVGTVAGADLVCQAQDAVLVCADPGGRLRVWALPVPPVAIA